MMRIARRGSTITTETTAATEDHTFDTETEAQAREEFINEALTWIGTPFRDCADIKGPKGAVDCAMLLARCAIDTGLLEPFDPRPYPPRWHLHRDEERFIGWIADKLGGKEVAAPRVGDIVVWRFGRTFSHGAVFIGCGEVAHAYYGAGMVLVSRMDESLLANIGLGSGTVPRPVKFFDLWSARK